MKQPKENDEETPAVTESSSVSNLPDVVSKALLDMSHTYSRAGGKKWHEYYTQETLDLVYETYEKDFEVFGYLCPILEQRTDGRMKLRTTTSNNDNDDDNDNNQSSNRPSQLKSQDSR